MNAVCRRLIRMQRSNLAKDSPAALTHSLRARSLSAFSSIFVLGGAPLLSIAREWLQPTCATCKRRAHGARRRGRPAPPRPVICTHSTRYTVGTIGRRTPPPPPPPPARSFCQLARQISMRQIRSRCQRCASSRPSSPARPAGWPPPAAPRSSCGRQRVGPSAPWRSPRAAGAR
jgi:hypothetical protein